MLARHARITRGADYRSVTKRGKKCGGPRLVTAILRTEEERPARFGFIVSKQVGNAVVRNTVRRRLKAVCAVAELPQGTDVVIRALPASADATFQQLQSDAMRCFSRVGEA